jgi:hypothetical protein
VLQRQRPDLAPARQQALNPVHPGRHQPPLQLAQHRAADPPAPPRRRQADPHHPRPVTAHHRDRDPHQLLTDNRDHRRLMRPDGRDQVRQAERRRLPAGRRVVPQPDGGIKIISMEIANPPRRHRISVPPATAPRPS